MSKVFLINGCFDLIHLGHLDFINSIKQEMNKNDKLVVLLNSDYNISKSKGFNRPIFSENYRKKFLLNLGVDEVILFDDEKAYDLINKIEPDIYYVGYDHSIENARKKLKINIFIKNKTNKYMVSTTKIIKDIKNGHKKLYK